VDAVAFFANIVVQAVQVLNQHGADLKSKFNLINSKELSILISIFSETTFFMLCLLTFLCLQFTKGILFLFDHLAEH
jgi:hypothetical protein